MNILAKFLPALECLQIRSKLPIVSLPSDTDTLETEILYFYLVKGKGGTWLHN